MTVLAAMLFLAVSVMLLVCLDGSLVYQAKARAGMAQTGLMEHLLANYNIPLAERYHLYFLDPRMNSQVLEERGRAYYDELFGHSSVSSLWKDPIWRIETEYLEAAPYGTMQEKEFQFFITQIEDCMKQDLTKDVFLKALNGAVQETENQSASLEEAVKKLDRNKPEESSSNSDDNTLTPSEVAEGEQAGSEVQKNNPLQKIRSILEHGLLAMVADESELSEQKISPSLLPFKNQKGNKITISMDILKNLDNVSEMLKSQGIHKLSESLSDQTMINLYIQKYFNHYGDSEVMDDTMLLYEVEYILGGQYSDKENLEYVVNKLILLRFALNATYAFSNEELGAQALSMAAVLTGITGTPEFMEAVRYLILAAVNLLESMRDVKDLLIGDKVPLVKSAADWRTSISGAVKGETGVRSKGLNYKEYSLLLLTLQTDKAAKCYRMQNLMQINLQKTQPEFQIRECRAGINIRSGVKVKPMFYLREYLFKDEQKSAY
ncbi:MAG: hypothetical protein E7253_06825 [Lachnospiraceae bacterium]|nr:hypothetical protein [Lachnospiraceae bacterium]